MTLPSGPKKQPNAHCPVLQVKSLRGTSRQATMTGVGPGQHALVTGLKGLPHAGDSVTVSACFGGGGGRGVSVDVGGVLAMVPVGVLL